MNIPGFEKAFEDQASKTDMQILGDNAVVLVTEQALLDLGYIIKPTRLGLYAFTCKEWERFEEDLENWKRNEDLHDPQTKPICTYYGVNIANVYLDYSKSK